jgi:hypothetical protein
MPSLLYISQSTESFAERQHRVDLANQAIAINRENALTGVLIFTNGYFMQLLEGPKNNLLDTFKRISADKRHHDVELLSFEENVERIFPAWNMNLVEFKETTSDTMARVAHIRQAIVDDPLLRCGDALEAFIAPQ